MQINENNDVQVVYDVSVKMSVDLEPTNYTDTNELTQCLEEVCK